MHASHSLHLPRIFKPSFPSNLPTTQPFISHSPRPLYHLVRPSLSILNLQKMSTRPKRNAKAPAPQRLREGTDGAGARHCWTCGRIICKYFLFGQTWNWGYKRWEKLESSMLRIWEILMYRAGMVIGTSDYSISPIVCYTRVVPFLFPLNIFIGFRFAIVFRWKEEWLQSKFHVSGKEDFIKLQ